MDSEKRDQSQGRRREEALARRMGLALDQLAHHDAGECPNAELIAAYYEKSLQADEIARWEGHFAICGRCRKILAVLAAAVEAPLSKQEVAHLGELVAAAGTSAEAPSAKAKPTRLNWRLRWLAPALGVAAVLAVWFAMRPPWRSADQRSSETLIAQAPKNEFPPTPEAQSTPRSVEVAPRQNSGAATEVLKDRSITRAQPQNSPADALANNRRDSGNAIGMLAPRPKDAESSLRDEKKEKNESNGTQPATDAFGGAPALPVPSASAAAQATAPPPAPPPARSSLPVAPRAKALSQAQDRVAPEAPSPAETPGQTAQSVEVTGAAPPVETTNRTLGRAIGSPNVKDLPLNGRNFQQLLKLDPAGEVAIQVKTPSGTVLWRAGRGGNIRQSTDTGRTWTPQTSPSQEDWLAGEAVSDRVCWLVGRNGAIARTTDGEHWERATLPPLSANSGKLPDVIGITANSAEAATITASDQRRYTTRDGGRTWRAQ
jgi:hypothetical protein